MEDVLSLVNDKRFVEYAINRTIPLSKMFDMVGKQFSYDHNVFCP